MKLRKNFLEIERYFIVDLSSIHENAINRTFRGLVTGEQEVGVFYCSWHSRQALQPNLGSYRKGYELMLQACISSPAWAASSWSRRRSKSFHSSRTRSTSVTTGEEHADVD